MASRLTRLLPLLVFVVFVVATCAIQDSDSHRLLHNQKISSLQSDQTNNNKVSYICCPLRVCCMPKICLIFTEQHRILYQSKSLKSSNSRVFNLPELCELPTFFFALLHHKLTSSRTQFSSGFGRNADKNDALAQQLELAGVRKPVMDSSVSTLILCSDFMPGNV